MDQEAELPMEVDPVKELDHEPMDVESVENVVVAARMMHGKGNDVDIGGSGMHVSEFIVNSLLRLRPFLRNKKILCSTEEELEALRDEISANRDVSLYIGKKLFPGLKLNPDIKKGITCLLFGGSHQKLDTDHRGDLHVLLLGDPGSGKSQLLKNVCKLGKNYVYTCGSGSSAAGLTAAVNRDQSVRIHSLRACNNRAPAVDDIPSV
ncbi:hypothetical protein QAD02_018435 [Eretmocerus hayati]|uniref:Uncharacterized protein n=1 Tax=Eretmocerus hayati TaxID=131215 RepID=A0ACC2PGP0_9HYME|nr:hypothetical protein QAD02_018435 [Eretmocerus hayati]